MRSLLAILFSLIVTAGSAQQIADACFFTVPTGPEFSNSNDLVNEPANDGGDMVKFENGDWSGTGVNLTIDPPFNCDAVKGVFLRPVGDNGEGFGLRFNAPLVAGQTISFELAHVSHGPGSDDDFQPIVYTSPVPQLFDGEILLGAQLGSLASAGGDWVVNDYNFNVTNQHAGNSYIFFYAPESSGIVLNLCQDGDQVINYDLPTNVEVCDGETVTLGDPSLAGSNISWSTGANSPTIQVTESGIYTLNVSNNCNSINDAALVTVFEDPILIPENDTTICLGTQLELRTEGLNAFNLWSNGSTDSLWIVSEPGIYGVTVTDDCGTANLEITVSLDSLPVFELGNDTTLCFNQELLLDATIPDPEATYLWSNSAETSFIPVVLNESSSYSVDVTNQCGTSSDDIFIEYSLSPESPFQGGYELCFGIPLLLDVSAVEGSYTWKDGSTASTFQVPSPGVYWVTIEDDDDCWEVTFQTEVEVIPCLCPMFLPNSFTPNGDGRNDEWAPVFECEPYDYLVKIYDRFGKHIYTLDDPSRKWNGKIGGEKLTDGVYTYTLEYREEYKGTPIRKVGHVVVVQE